MFRVELVDLRAIAADPRCLGSLAFLWGQKQETTETWFNLFTEQGRALGFNLGVSMKAIGSQYEVYSASWRYAEYIPMPWRPRPLRNHTLILSYAGAISGGELRRRPGYYIGGYSATTMDVVRAFFDFTRAGPASLRGYPYASIGGNEVHLLNAEYRFPIVNIDRVRKLSPTFAGEYAVILSDGTKLRLSRGYHDRIATLLKQSL